MPAQHHHQRFIARLNRMWHRGAFEVLVGLLLAVVFLLLLAR